MKKIYIKPEITIVTVETETVLAGSYNKDPYAKDAWDKGSFGPGFEEGWGDEDNW